MCRGFSSNCGGFCKGLSWRISWGILPPNIQENKSGCKNQEKRSVAQIIYEICENSDLPKTSRDKSQIALFNLQMRFARTSRNSTVSELGSHPSFGSPQGFCLRSLTTANFIALLYPNIFAGCSCWRRTYKVTIIFHMWHANQFMNPRWPRIRCEFSLL